MNEAVDVRSREESGPRSLLQMLAAPVPWQTWQVRALTYGLLLIQAAQTAWRPTNDYSLSYWLLNYDRGFARRGLGGEFAQLLPIDLSQSIKVAAALAAIVCIVAVIVLLEVLVRRRTTATAALAVLIVGSPFLVDQVLSQRRPDQLGLVLLIATGFASMRPSSRWVFGLLGLLFGASMFVHEGIAFYYLPAAAFLLLLRHDRRDVDVPSALLLLVPPALGVAIVTAFGTATVKDVAALQASLPLPDPNWNIQVMMGDSLGDTIQRVGDVEVDGATLVPASQHRVLRHRSGGHLRDGHRLDALDVHPRLGLSLRGCFRRAR
jgi:hypothetical protein